MRSAPPIPERLFASVQETAEVLGVDPRTVRRAVAEGQIPASHVGVRVLIPTKWLREAAQSGGGDAATA
jgi:excisionase family DNA binding protein